jgi:hypothetical protein
VGEAGAIGLTLREKAAVESSLSTSIYGTASEVRPQLERLAAVTGADELLITGGAFDVAAQVESDRLLAGIFFQDGDTAAEDSGITGRVGAGPVQ